MHNANQKIMATCNNRKPFKDRINAPVCCTRDGVPYVRASARPKAKNWLKDTRYRQIRNSCVEFGGHAKMSAAFRGALRRVREYCDSSLWSRAGKLFTKVRKADTSAPVGQRGFMMSRHKQFFFGLELNNACPVNTFGRLDTMSTLSPDRTRSRVEATLSLKNRRELPKHATHFCITHVLSMVPDIVYDQDTGRYREVSLHTGAGSAMTSSPFIPLDGSRKKSVVLETMLSLPDFSPDVTVMELVGIRFYINASDQYRPLPTGMAMRVINLF